MIKVWFIGTGFNGSQRQTDKRTVEGELLYVLQKRGYISDAESANFKAAIRTDAGVNARCAVFGFNTEQALRLGEIDAFLPDDMGVWAWAEVPLDLKPRFEAQWKQYYYIFLKSAHDQIDLSIMQNAFQFSLGNIISAFSVKTISAKKALNIRFHLFEIKITEDANTFQFSFKANAFLWQSIRRSVNYLLEIGRGNLTAEDLEELFTEVNLQNPRFKKIGQNAPMD